ncbi:MAG: methyltransferase domain-containing protein [Mitsuaria chitosanitabida]|uniref:CheR family methyltransferase n=1 Tax=Roseateles chitosanitabidus TaxID=65048 RepID=UPI001B114F4C|nr:CheR family methyltransferase [Roseateles chitosanitabidus]MBO9689842.1 methyltransferase domain-containing protein [Roseateles chitosanitabidus]
MSRAAPADPALLPRLRAVLASRLGLQFDERQDDWLTAALTRVAGTTGPERFLAQMEVAPTRERLDALAAELTVGETFFFRHPEQLDALRFDLLPRMTRRALSDAALTGAAPQRLRVLSAGCASGEEAYTLAITLQRAGLQVQGLDWEVLAIDLNPAALARGLAARYGEWSLRATPAELRDLWFRRVDKADVNEADGDSRGGRGWTPIPGIRERVRFEQRHLGLPDAGFWTPARFDIIFCRNVLMYLEPAALRQAIRNLTGALAPGGVLFVGHAETLRGHTDALSLRQAQGCFFYEREAADAARRTERPAGQQRPIVGVPGASPEADEETALGLDRCLPPSWPFPWSSASAAPGVARSASETRGAPAGPDAQRADASGRNGDQALLDEALRLVEAGLIDDGLRACARLSSPELPPALQAEVLYLQALAMEERGQLPSAEWHHQRAAAKDAGFAMPHLRLGLMARRRGEIVAAHRELRRALALLDDESAARLRRFGGGFERDDLRRLCRDEIGEAHA